MSIILLSQTRPRIELRGLFAPASFTVPDIDVEGDATYPTYTADGFINNELPLPKVYFLRSLNIARIELRPNVPPVAIGLEPLLIGDATYPTYTADGYIGFLEVEVADAVYPTYTAEGYIASGNVEMRSMAPMAYATFRVRVNNRRRKVMFVVNR